MWWRRKPDERARTRGFILIEVLVAAAVAAVLIAAVMRIFASTWSGINSIREDADAMLVARSVIDAVAPRSGLAPGTQQGTAGRYGWTVVITGPIVQVPPPSVSVTSPTQAGAGAAAANPADGNAANPNAQQANTGPQWRLFRIIVAVSAPGGRRTVVDTYRLSRSSA